MTTYASLLPVAADDREARRRAASDVMRYAGAVKFDDALAFHRRRVMVERAAGVNPAHPRGEDGPAVARHHSPTVADDGLGAARGVGCVLVAVAMLAAVAYLWSIN